MQRRTPPFVELTLSMLAAPATHPRTRAAFIGAAMYGLMMGLFAGVLVVGNEVSLVLRIMLLGTVIGVAIPLALGEIVRVTKGSDASLPLSLLAILGIVIAAVLVLFP